MDSDDVPSDVHDGWQWRQTSKDSACAPPFSASCVACGNGGAVMDNSANLANALLASEQARVALENERDAWRERAETAQECAARAEAERSMMSGRLASLEMTISTLERVNATIRSEAQETRANAKRWREECARAWLHASEAAAERAKELDEDNDE